MKTTHVLMPVLLALAVCGCDRAAAPDTSRATDTPAPAADGSVPGALPATPPVEPSIDEATPPAPGAAPAAFVDKVWRVRESSAVATGTRYSFLGDGTLVIQGAEGPPGYGRWTYENDALTIIEEGIAYPTDIFALDAGHFEILSYNPGKPEPVTILLEADTDAPLPASPPK